MAAQSARQAGDRPFYAAYGWAYDLLITRPVRPWADMVSAALDSAGIAAPARMLDAGCGTGRHGAELARRGYRLDLVDASASLLGQARARLPHAPAHRADLCTLGPGTRYDAITTPPSRRPAPGETPSWIRRSSMTCSNATTPLPPSAGRTTGCATGIPGTTWDTPSAAGWRSTGSRSSCLPATSP
jgi:SAM-dependent methyltransferase